MALEIVRGDLSWSGEHWICMLREPGSDDTAVVRTQPMVGPVAAPQPSVSQSLGF